MQSRLAIASMSILLMAAACLNVSAQQSQQQTVNQNPAKKDPNWPPKHKPGPAEQNVFYTTKRLPKEPEMPPELPRYSGQTKLVWSLAYPPQPNGDQCYDVRYYAKEPQAMVRDWYFGALRASGYLMPPSAQTPNTIVGVHQKTGLMVQITTNSNAPFGYKSEFYLRYTIPGKKS